MKRDWETCKKCMFFDVVMVENGLPVLRCTKDGNVTNWTRVDRKASWKELDMPTEGCFWDKTKGGKKMEVVRGDGKAGKLNNAEAIGALPKKMDDRKRIYRDIEVCQSCEHFKRKMTQESDGKERECYACEADRIKIGWMNKTIYEHEYADSATCPFLTDLKFVSWNDDNEKEDSFKARREEQIRKSHERILESKLNGIHKTKQKRKEK